MSNRNFKVFLWKTNPCCHWCGRETLLTHIPNIKGEPNPLMATIDHVISRYSLQRWVKRKPGERRKVLACYECNQRRSVKETEQLPKEEILRRGRGFAFNPRGKPIIVQTFNSVVEVALFLKEKGVDIPQEYDMVTV